MEGIKVSDCLIVSFIFNGDNNDDDLMVVGRSDEKGSEYVQIVNAVQGERAKEMYKLLTGDNGGLTEDVEKVKNVEEVSKEEA